MGETKQKPVKQYRHKPYSPAWERQAASIAMSYAPTIYPCKDCGAPTIEGYCCQYCGSTNPSHAT